MLALCVCVCVCVCVPLDVALLPGQLTVAVVELVHDQVDLGRGQVVGQHAVLARQQGLQHVGQRLQEWTWKADRRVTE